ncbi:hypothetical protein CTI14_59440, partial [Methylobacterium radiotolerans]
WVDPTIVAAESSTPEFDASVGTEEETGLLRDANARPEDPASASAVPAVDPPVTEAVAWADASAPATALTWVDPTIVAAESSTPEFDASVGTEEETGLLRDA